jgi:hypothetical protein
MVLHADTHYIADLSRSDGRVQRSVCGAMIHVVDHTASPSCAQCKAWIEADAADTAQYETVEAHAEALFGAARSGRTPDLRARSELRTTRHLSTAKGRALMTCGRCRLPISGERAAQSRDWF